MAKQQRFILWESQLKTVHPKGHPRARKRIRMYIALRFVRDDDGVPIYEMASKWHEENPKAALAQAKTKHFPK